MKMERCTAGTKKISPDSLAKARVHRPSKVKVGTPKAEDEFLTNLAQTHDLSITPWEEKMKSNLVLIYWRDFD